MLMRFTDDLYVLFQQALARLAEARRHEHAQRDGDLDVDNRSDNSVNTAVTSVSNLAIQVFIIKVHIF